MSLLITLDVFSGRPNPVWLLDDEDEREVRRCLEEVRAVTSMRPSGALGRLGYRGFLVHEPADVHGETLLRVHEGILDRGPRAPNRLARNRELEWLLLETAGDALPERVRAHVEQAIEPELAAELREPDELFERYRVGCPPSEATDAPAYDPDRWNVPSVQPHNNCYNYANDQVTNTFAQPGRAAGVPFEELTCDAVGRAARSDGFQAQGSFGDHRGSGQGWYVALVIWPAVDYHWYRQDDSGCWSHKPGPTPARDVDDSGSQITDPRTADRGPYTDFCTYMVTTRRVTIR